MQYHLKENITNLLTAVFILLFVYTATSKLLALNTFEAVLSKSPVIGGASSVVAVAIPVLEFVIGLMLVFRSTRKIGLYCFLYTMLCFTGYILYMLLTSSKLPCSCGGVITSLSWQQHLWLNSIISLMAIATIKMLPEHKSFGQDPEPFLNKSIAQ